METAGIADVKKWFESNGKPTLLSKRKKAFATGKAQQERILHELAIRVES